MLDLLVIIILLGIIFWMTRPSREGTHYLDKDIRALLYRRRNRREDLDE